jgi:hypothetical protein
VRVGVALALLAACGSKSQEPEPGPAPPALKSIGTYPGAQLVSNGVRVVVVHGDRWLDVGPERPVGDALVATQLARLRAELGEVEVFLGVYPIVVGGEEHHEQHLRIEREARAVELEGHLMRVAAVGEHELWHFEERLQARLASVDARGTVGVLPSHANVGARVDSASPVGAKRCATPAIADLAVAGDAIVALLVECHPEAPVRLARHRGAAVDVQQYSLGFAASQLAGDVIVGIANGRLAYARDGVVTTTPIAASRVIDAARASDGAVWTLSTTERDARTLARDGTAIKLAGIPAQLANDDDRGIVVLATEGSLYSER